MRTPKDDFQEALKEHAQLRVAALRIAHHRMHMEDIPHDCRRYYKWEAFCLCDAIIKNPSMHPALLYKYYENEWN